MDNKENIDPISEGTHTTIVLLHSDIENDDFFFSDDSVTLETPETTTNTSTTILVMTKNVV